MKSSHAFVHLRVHSEYSLIDSIITIPDLVKKVAEYQMPAVALTDQSNICAAVKFFQLAVDSGIKPLIGSDLWLENEVDINSPTRFSVLVRNQQGFANLMTLLSKAYLEGRHLDKAILKKAWLDSSSEGLLVLSGGMHGIIGQLLLAGKFLQAEKELAWWLEHFPQRFYMELHRIGVPYEENYNQEALRLCAKKNCPVVATNPVCFLEQSDFEAHETRVCIGEGRILADTRRPRHHTDLQYLATAEEMCSRFADIPEAIANTIEIAKRCNFRLTTGQIFLPNYPVPESFTLEDFLKKEARIGLENRLTAKSLNAQELTSYQERLERELEMIITMGFAGYFLIVMDFIRWAKENGIPVGPGRGSGAGSLVAYALSITDLDPLQYDLLFERFLNPERVSMPDFDIDFCMEGRDRVIDYVTKKYGAEAVSQIITFGTMAAKAVVRDVTRAQGKSYGLGDKIAKLIPFEVGMTLEKALQQVGALKQLYDESEEVREIIDMSFKLEGLIRNVGRHAGGVVIAPSRLTDFTPLYCDESGLGAVTQFDKDDVEQIGLVKFDFLGLRTLTIIDWTLKSIGEHRLAKADFPANFAELPLNDAATYALLSSGKTTAVFQLESRGMKELIARLEPTCFEDIVALVALFRPGPLQSGMVDDFINRKHGKSRIDYPHPALEPILKNTYGVILYQEQVMQIAQVLAGYSLGEADLLRRAMGKKKPEEMAKQRAVFLQGSTNNGVDVDIANYIFDLMEKFAGYGFNKSHSAAYALLSYQTAWLKTHYPEALMAAVLSADMHNTDKIVHLIDAVRELAITIRSPNINSSDYKFTLNAEGEIVYGLGAIKGVGEAVINDLVMDRKKNGKFLSLFDLCQRAELRKLNKRVLEALIKSGTLDDFGVERATLLASLEKAVKTAEQYWQNHQAGMNDLFATHMPMAKTLDDYVTTKPWTATQRLSAEKETLGLYLTGHPIGRYQTEIATIVSARIADLKISTKTETIAGFITTIRILKNKRGQQMAFLTLDDQSARIDVSVFAENFQQFRSLINKDQLVIVDGEVDQDDYTGQLRMRALKFRSIDEIREAAAAAILLDLSDAQQKNDFATKLALVLKDHKKGRCPILLKVEKNAVSGNISLGEQWQYSPTEKLLEDLRELCGETKVKLLYE